MIWKESEVLLLTGSSARETRGVTALTAGVLIRAARIVPPDTDFFGPAAHVFRIVPRLHPQERFHVHLKRLFNAEGHLG